MSIEALEERIFGDHNQVHQEIITEVDSNGRTYTRLSPSDDEVLIRWGIDLNKITDLHRHALFFATEDGRFTTGSIRDRLIKLGSSDTEADAVAVGLMGAFHIMIKGEVHIRNILQLIHVTASNIFDPKTGNFDEARFDQVASQYGPKGYVTPEAIKKLFKDCYRRDKAEHPIQCLAFKAIGPGEFNLFVKLFSDSPEGGVLNETLKKMFTCGSLVFWEKVAQQNAQFMLKTS